MIPLLALRGYEMAMKHQASMKMLSGELMSR